MTPYSAIDCELSVTHKDVKHIEQVLNKNLPSLYDWLIDKLSIHLGKTESILFGTRNKFKRFIYRKQTFLIKIFDV